MAEKVAKQRRKLKEKPQKIKEGKNINEAYKDVLILQFKN